MVNKMTTCDYLDEPSTIQVEAIKLETYMVEVGFNISEASRQLDVTRATMAKRLSELKKGKEWLLQVHRSDDGKIACYTFFNGDA
jgi:CRP-like cAMP-binding protein